MQRVNVTPAQRHTGNRKHYALKQVIGKGAYGVVYKAVNRATEQVIAIKAIEYDNEEELQEHMLEIDLLKNLKHDNIVKYHGFIQSSHELYILLEYCIRGSLRDLVKKQPLSEVKAKTYIKQTLRGLQYLHDQGVIHRDIKAANLLLTEDGTIKLADFGVSTRVNNMAMTYAGSPNWMAPEVMLGKGASTVSDIWSLGATVVELLTGNPPFYNLVNEAACYAIVNDVYYPPEHLSSKCKKFIECCFQKNMFKRPQAHQLLQNVWLQEGKDKLEQFREDPTPVDKWDADFFQIDAVTRSPSPKKQLGDSYKYTDQLKTGNLLNSPDVIMQNVTAEEMSDLMFEIGTSDSQKGTQGKILSNLFALDKDYLSCAGSKLFVSMGGVPLLMKHEKVLATYFSSNIPLLVQCGILTYVNSLQNTPFLLQIVEYLNRTLSSERWAKWCSTVSSLQDALTKELLLGNKSAEFILLQLSTSPAFLFDFTKLMIPNFSGSKAKHVIFKCFNNILKRAYSVDLSYTPTNSVSASSTISSLQFHVDSSLYPRGEILPDDFVDWLLKFIPYTDGSSKEIKIFLELFYYSSHLNPKRLRQLVESNKFLPFISDLQQNVKFLHSATCLNVCVDISNELNKAAFPEMLNIANRFLEHSELFTNTVEIILNCTLFAIREGYQCDVNRQRTLIEVDKNGIKCGSIACGILINRFFEKEDQFPKFVAKYTRLLALPPFGKLCYDLVLDPRFVDKVTRIFTLYQASLIIQIDALKFLKIALTRALEYTPPSKGTKDINPKKLLESTLNNPIYNTNEHQLNQTVGRLSKFLLSNWTSSKLPQLIHPNTSGPLLDPSIISPPHSPPPSRQARLGKVGNDSILIHQLSDDIASLCKGNHRPVHDFEGFLIPSKVPSGD
ncbi:HBR191Cp [Eremothecium sinecaudum]|uniref:non-specific serine/threonine protein kinase n=1 Tax=Eremothecium sinecaudum TaxID=45286 RepID=A0A109UXF4_9SACH|nr:HBR191Cp [Eremothecium sinecaudum]AMD19092.1 HBR191Cp [Eremothecium sinecaudum]